MKVLITGVTSFVGCHLALGFRSAGHDVVGTVHGPATRSESIRARRLALIAARGIALRSLDLRSADAIETTAARERPEIWVQHAGYTRSYGSADYDLGIGFDLNVLPLGAIYRAMADISGGVILTGTGAEYSDSEQPHSEDFPCLPTTPYGLAKLAGTLRARQLSRTLGVPTRIARIFLPFGPLDAPEKLLPSVLSALRAGRRIPLSHCRQQRDFVYISDVVSLYLALAQDIADGGCEIFNVCTGEAVRLGDLISEIAKRLGADPALCDFNAIPMRPGESMVMLGSADKARRKLAHSPLQWCEAVRCFVREA